MISSQYRALLQIILAVGISLCAGLIVFWICNKNIVPNWDMINVLHFLLGGKTGGVPPNLLSPDLLKFIDNEHRPYLPMFIWNADLLYFDSLGYLPQAIILLCSLLNGVLVTSWARLEKQWSLESTTVTVFACLVMLAPMHYENLIWPKQVHVLLATLLSLLSFKFSLALYGTHGWRQLGRAVAVSVLAFGATFSFAYGLVAWPALLIHGALKRWPLRAYIIVVVAATITLGLYYSHYSVLAHHSDPRQTIFDPLHLLTYAASLLATPLDLFNHERTVIVGLALLLVSAAASIRTYVTGKRIEDGQAMSLMICIYAFGIGILTALGRLDINSGQDSRYLIVAAMFLLAVPGLFPGLLSKYTSARKVIVTAFILTSLIIFIASWLRYEHQLRSSQFQIREGAIAAALKTTPILRGLHPELEITNNLVWPYYAENHKNRRSIEVFGWLDNSLPGGVIGFDEGGQENRCPGSVDGLINRENAPDFDETWGWARFGVTGERRATWILITDQHKRLVGLATTGETRPDVAQFLNSGWLDDQLTLSGRAGFRGQIRSKPGSVLDFYAYRNGEACLFAEDVSVSAK